MVPHNSGTVDFLSLSRTFFVRLCFCVGFGMVSYASFAQIKIWVSSDAPSSKSSFFQDKVSEIESQPVRRMSSEQMLPVSAVEVPGLRHVKAMPDTSVVKPEEVAKPDEADKAAGEKPAEPLTTESSDLKAPSDSEIVNAEPVNIPDSPYQQAYYQAYLDARAQMAAEMNAEKNSDKKMGSLPSVEMTNQASAQELAMAALLAAQQVQRTSGSGYHYTPAATSPNAQANAGAGLSAQDIAWLTAGIKATLADGTLSPQSVQNCNAADIPGMENPTNCTDLGAATIPSLRWGYSRGIDSHPGVTIRASNGAHPIEMEIKFPIQTGNALTQDEVRVPALTKITSSSDGSKKTFVLQFSDITIGAGETLSQLKATLVFQVNGQAATLLNESSLNFVRAKMNTQNTPFVPSAPAPAFTGGSFIRASGVPYSITLEKH